MRETLERDPCGVWFCELGLKTSGLAFKFGCFYKKLVQTWAIGRVYRKQICVYVYTYV